MATIKKPICTLGIIGILTFILFIVTAQAAQPVDCLLCSDRTTTTVVQTRRFSHYGLRSKGIVLDNTGSKFFDNATVHLVG